MDVLLALLFPNKKEKKSGKRFSLYVYYCFLERDGMRGKHVVWLPGWFGEHQQKNVFMVLI